MITTSQLARSFSYLFLFTLPVMVSARAPAYYPPYGYQPAGRYTQPYPDRQPRPYWYPQQAQAPQYAPTPPRVETLVNDTAPYEQQSLVYRVRVISSGNLRSVTPLLPEDSAVILRPLGEPLSENRQQNGTRELVTEYRYLLMPLSGGVIEIPPVRVTGHFSGSNGKDGPTFDVAGKPVVLHVRPATDAVQPWLPLYRLQITARVRGGEAPAAGNPIELEIETRAVGATGAQIPSVANHLESTDFHIYPGESSSEGKLSADGKTLLGSRVETFTLVPRYGGWLQLPGVSINWWNVRYNRPEVATLLTDRIHVMGPTDPQHRGHGNDRVVRSAVYWLPMVFAVGVLLFGWLSAFMGDGRLPGAESVRKLFKARLGKLYPPLVALAERLSPRRSFHRLRTWTGRRLPVSWKLWFCLRVVARENDPAEWAQALQFLAARHLGARPQAHLRQLGRTIARCHPRANAAELDHLLAELDQAVYGNRPVQDFQRWKQEFRKQIKPGLLPVRFRRRGIAAALSAPLPGLNPP